MKIKKIKPMFTALVTTMDKYSEPQYMPGSTIIDPTKTKTGLKEYQTVIEVGDHVRGVKPGDVVCINPSAYAVKKYRSDGIKDGIEGMNLVESYNFNVVLVDDKELLLIQERDIDFVVVEYEMDEKDKSK